MGCCNTTDGVDLQGWRFPALRLRSVHDKDKEFTEPKAGHKSEYRDQSEHSSLSHISLFSFASYPYNSFFPLCLSNHQFLQQQYKLSSLQ